MGKKGALEATPAKLDKQAYEKELKRLQAHLVDMQQWVVETGARVVIVMEGRDAAGKGSAISRITQYLNPRVCRVEALPKPNDEERGQWYFQRYIERLPAAGEIVIFDRSWYNRAGVERVMGFCSTTEYRRFLAQAPTLERMLVEDGIILRKYWFSVSADEQLRRFRSRIDDPLRRWKLSPMDLESINRWDEYSKAKDEMFIHTDTSMAPWHIVESEDKKRSRINVISHLLDTVPYEASSPYVPTLPERAGQDQVERPSRGEFRYVPDEAAQLEVDAAPAKKDKKAKDAKKAKKSKKDQKMANDKKLKPKNKRKKKK